MVDLYARDMAAAARRHFHAAERLVDTDRNDVAGYLYGWAAECGLKDIMLESGMRELPEGKRRDDPFYAHFETLRDMVLDRASGHRADTLIKLTRSSSFMQFWSTDMRYSDGRAIRPAWVERWRKAAKDVLAEVG